MLTPGEGDDGGGAGPPREGGTPPFTFSWLYVDRTPSQGQKRTYVCVCVGYATQFTSDVSRGNSKGNYRPILAAFLTPPEKEEIPKKA